MCWLYILSFVVHVLTVHSVLCTARADYLFCPLSCTCWLLVVFIVVLILTGASSFFPPEKYFVSSWQSVFRTTRSGRHRLNCSTLVPNYFTLQVDTFMQQRNFLSSLSFNLSLSTSVFFCPSVCLSYLLCLRSFQFTVSEPWGCMLVHSEWNV